MANDIHPDTSSLLTPLRLWLLFLVLAAVSFAPFFLQGRMLVVSTDNYYYIFPNLLFGRDALLHGDFWTWNRFLLAGVDFSSSNYNFMYSPVYWLIYLFPEHLFFTGLTLVNFALLWVAGVAAYYFLREETGHAWGSLLGAVAYQISGNMFFSLNTYPYFMGYALCMVVLYLLWTMHKRSWALSFFLLSATIATLILSCHVVRAFMFMVLICLCTTYRLWPKRFNLRSLLSRPNVVAIGAILCGVLIAFIRIIPLMADLHGSDRLVNVEFWKYTSSTNSIYYLVNTFLPELFPLRQPAQSVLHDPYFTSYAYVVGYCGVASLFLAAYGLFNTKGNKLFWVFLFTIAVLFNMQAKPVSDFLKLLLYPAFHAFCLRIITPVPFSVMIALGAKALARAPSRKHGLWLASVMGVALVMGSIGFLMDNVDQAPAFKVILILGLGALLAMGLFIDHRHFNRVLTMTLPAAAALIILALRFLTSNWSLMGNNEALYILQYYCIAIASLAAASLILGFMPRDRKIWPWLAAAALCCGLLVTLAVPAPGEYGQLPPETFTVFLRLGLMRSLLLAVVFAQLVLHLGVGRIGVQTAFLLMLALLVLDLANSNRVHADVITRSFWQHNELDYPGRWDHRFNDLTRPMPAPGPDSTNYAVNGDFEAWEDGAPSGWRASNTGVMTRVQGQDALTGASAIHASVTEPGPSVFMDVPPPQFANVEGPPLDLDSMVAVGAWVKTDTPGAVSLMVGTRTRAVYSTPHTGSGDWEWLTVKHLFPTGDPTDDIILRVHIWIDPAAVALVDGVVVNQGPYPVPFLGADPDSVPPELAAMPLPEDPLPLDLKNYRLPQPSSFLGIGNMYHYTHIPYLYGIPSFGGVNGFRSPWLLALMDRFTAEDEPGDNGGARFEYLRSPRFNDIMGCGYDIVDGEIVRRPGALARFTLFHEARVMADENALLERLGADDFVPQQTLLLASLPNGIDIPGSGPPARMLDYEQVGSREIHLHVETDQDAVLLFNDSYDTGWTGSVDGHEQVPVRANENFMAIGVPAGSHDVAFRFLPSDWLPRVAGTLSGLFLLVGGTALLAALQYRRRASQKTTATQNEMPSNGS